MTFWRSLGESLDRWVTWGGVCAELADETSAYLDGRLLERTRGTTGHAPDWMWLNAVAHGDPARLHELAATTRGRHGQRVGGWPRVRAELAEELLALTGDDPAEARRVQTTVLVPVESRVSRMSGLTPRELHALVADELQRALRDPDG